MQRLPISVFIIAKNEADRLPHTLLSVRELADEVIVIDSGSTDGTVRVATELGARVLSNPWTGYGPQKVFGESQCTHRWLLNLDADEALTPELIDEIRALFEHGEPIAKGYIVKIKALYRFEEKLPWYAAGTTQIRLYERNHAGFKDAYVHDSVVMKNGEKAVLLKAPVVHRCFRSLSHMVEKMNGYTSMQAEDLVARGKRISALYLVTTPLVAFFKSYVMRGYILYGRDGVTYSYLYAMGRLLRAAKARELWQAKAHK